jgi:shikimate kinase
MSAPVWPVEHLSLMGLMGCGKTSVATELSDRLGWPMVDNDRALEVGTGRTLLELAGFGPDVLHRLEGLQADLALAAPGPLVVTLAASLADDEARREAVRSRSLVVYLRAAPEVLASRVTGTPRPWLLPDPRLALAAMFERRDPWLRAIAHLVVETGDRSPSAVADEVVSWLGPAVRPTGAAADD